MTIMTQDSTHKKKPAARDESQAAAGETLGGYLRKHRLQQNQKLEDITGKIRIPTAILLAIEEDNHAALPAEVFTRGFIKSYARQLDLDPEEALLWHIRQTARGGKSREEKINVHEVLASEELAQPPNLRWGRILFFLVLVFSLAVLGYMAFTSDDLSSLDREEVNKETVLEPPAWEQESMPPAGGPEFPEEKISPGAEESPGVPAASSNGPSRTAIADSLPAPGHTAKQGPAA
jgi:cytoskeleton protein RodZ